VLNLKGSATRHANFGRNQHGDGGIFHWRARRGASRCKGSKMVIPSVPRLPLRSERVRAWHNWGRRHTTMTPPDLLLPHSYPLRGKNKSPRWTRVLARAHRRQCTEPSVLCQVTVHHWTSTRVPNDRSWGAICSRNRTALDWVQYKKIVHQC
jgi:hypothetical protein